MGRRSLIPLSTINRLISTSNRIKREEENNRLIQAQGGTAKELDPEYFLEKVDFDSATRVTKIEILQSQKYRTIVKYVTQNYKKYPIFSEWKTRTKIIKKTIKLTNVELERLNYHGDYLITRFATQIISLLNDEELFPSWFINDFLREEYEDKLSELKTNHETFIEEKKSNIKKNEEQIGIFNQELIKLNLSLTKRNKYHKKLVTKIKKIENSTPSFFKSLFTLFIYSYLISQKRKNKLYVKKEATDNLIASLLKSIKLKEASIKEFENKISILKEEIALQLTKYEVDKKQELILYQEKLSEIIPLPSNYENDNTFIPLKKLIGFDYEKIIGCYVIHNTENNKYYVGQSKDIYKRIKQHFSGTTPKNVIFAEDYYLSNLQDKENLFEIKIIPCKTKDELDDTEKELIEAYDSCNSGYNGTKGNT